MNKRFIVLFILLFTAYTLCAEAPELHNVMPNSWKKLERLTAKEEAAFLRENNSIVKQIRDYYCFPGSYFYSYFDPMEIELRLKFTRVYREATGLDIFYRIILSDKSDPDFLSSEINFFQGLVGAHYGKNTLLFMGCYRVDNTNQLGSNEIYNSIDIIASKGRAKGILATYLEVGDLYRLDGSNRNGSNYCEYRLLEKLPSVIEFEQWTPRAYIQDMECVDIHGSSCLIDTKSPLRYSLGSAFDGDPATSYVENTKDDLLEITFAYLSEKMKKVAVINGYAQNISLYKKNNRVKSIGIEVSEWDDAKGYRDYILKEEKLLKDDCLSYQVFDVASHGKISVRDVYRGSAYKDTCIAELNIKTDKGWLFGEIDE